MNDEHANTASDAHVASAPRQPTEPSVHQLRIRIALAHAGLGHLDVPDDATLRSAATAWIAADGRGLELARDDGAIIAAWRADGGEHGEELGGERGVALLGAPKAADDLAKELPAAWSASLPPWLLARPAWREASDGMDRHRWRICLVRTEQPERIAGALDNAAAICGAMALPTPLVPTAIASARARCVWLLLRSDAQSTFAELEVTGIAERVARLGHEEGVASLGPPASPAFGERRAHGSDRAARPSDAQQRDAVAFGVGVRALTGLRLRAHQEPLQGWTLALA